MSGAVARIVGDLRHVVGRLSAFYAPGEMRSWLHTPHPLLDGARALDLVMENRTDEVLAVIRRLEVGAYL